MDPSPSIQPPEEEVLLKRIKQRRKDMMRFYQIDNKSFNDYLDKKVNKKKFKEDGQLNKIKYYKELLYESVLLRLEYMLRFNPSAAEETLKKIKKPDWTSNIIKSYIKEVDNLQPDEKRTLFNLLKNSCNEKEKNAAFIAFINLIISNCNPVSNLSINYQLKEMLGNKDILNVQQPMVVEKKEKVKKSVPNTIVEPLSKKVSTSSLLIKEGPYGFRHSKYAADYRRRWPNVKPNDASYDKEELGTFRNVATIKLVPNPYFKGSSQISIGEDPWVALQHAKRNNNAKYITLTSISRIPGGDDNYEKTPATTHSEQVAFKALSLGYKKDGNYFNVLNNAPQQDYDGYAKYYDEITQGGKYIIKWLYTEREPCGSNYKNFCGGVIDKISHIQNEKYGIPIVVYYSHPYEKTSNTVKQIIAKGMHESRGYPLAKNQSKHDALKDDLKRDIILGKNNIDSYDISETSIKTNPDDYKDTSKKKVQALDFKGDRLTNDPVIKSLKDYEKYVRYLSNEIFKASNLPGQIHHIELNQMLATCQTILSYLNINIGNSIKNGEKCINQHFLNENINNISKLHDELQRFNDHKGNNAKILSFEDHQKINLPNSSINKPQITIPISLSGPQIKPFGSR